MALVYADRVLETSTTTGLGTFDLAGVKSGGYQTFVAGIGSTNTCYYCIENPSADEWEVGLGTVTDAVTDTLTRTTVIASSNADAAVNFSAGTKNVFAVLPAMVSGTEQIKLSAILNAGGFKLTNVADPASAQDAATRSWTLAQIDAHELVTDLSPQLGGDLDVNDFAIKSINGGDVVFTADAPGNFIFNNGNILGDFSNATKANRVGFETSTADSFTILTAAPSGTGSGAYLQLFEDNDRDNTSGLTLGATAAKNYLRSEAFGTGSLQPLSFEIGASIAQTIGTDLSTTFGGDILADWSSAPGSRDVLKSSTTNGISAVTITPNGTGTEAYIVMEDNSTVGNNQFVSLGINATAASINSSKRGTGTAVPFQIIMDGSPVLEVETNFTLNVANVLNYENLVTADDDIPNRKWVTDQAYLQAADLTGYLQNIVEDTTPELGGDLTADWSNATANLRIALETSGTDTFTAIPVRPSGTGANAYVVFQADNDIDNTAYLNVGHATSAAVLNSSKAGTGTTVGFEFQIDGTAALTIGTDQSSTFSGNIDVGSNDILGDWSNATTSLRTRWKTNTVNGSTGVVVAADGTGNGAYHNMYAQSDVDNTSTLNMGTTTSITFIGSNKTGTGVARNLELQSAGTTVLTLETDGTISTPNATYETLVTADDDIPNRKWVTDQAYLQAADLAGYLQNIVEDTTPELGGNLNANNKYIYTTAGNLLLKFPAAATSGTGLGVQISAQDQTGASAWGGSTTISAGSSTNGSAGTLILEGGDGNLFGGVVRIVGGNATTGASAGGDIELLVGYNSATGAGVGNVVITAGDGTTAPQLRLREARDNGTAYVAFRAPTDVTTSRIWTLPADAPVNGHVLQTDGGGQLSFVAPATGGINNVVEDTTPELGGDLDMAGNDIYEDANPGTQGSPLGKFIGRWNTLDVAYMEFQSGSDTVSKDSGQIAFYTQEQGGTGGIKLLIDEFGRLITGGSDCLYTANPDGSLTVSSGDSGVTLPFTGPLVVENSGNGGVCINTPDANIGQVMFGSPTDTSGAAIRWEYGTAGATKELEVATRTSGGELVLCSDAVQRRLLIDATGRIITNINAPQNVDLLGAEGGAVTISTGNSGVTTPLTTADDLIIENDGDAGITIATPATASGALVFTDANGLNMGGFTYAHTTNELFTVVNNSTVGTISSTGQHAFKANNVTPIRAYRENVGAAAGGKSGPIFYWDVSDDLVSHVALYFRGNVDAAQPLININTAGGPALGLSPSNEGASNDGILMNETNIIFGDWATDLLGADAGSVTISTGNSGVTSPAIQHDDFIIESDGATGMLIACPDASIGQIRFGTPGETTAAVIRWDYGTAGATKEFEIGSSATGAVTHILGGNAVSNIKVGSSQVVIGDTTQTAGEAQLLVSESSSGATASGAANNFVIEGSGTVGMSILGGTTNNCGIYFGDSSNAAQSAIIHVNSSSSLDFYTGSGTTQHRLRIASNGTLEVKTTNYENLVTADDDVPNKKYVDDRTPKITFVDATSTSNLTIGTVAASSASVLDFGTVTIPTTGWIGIVGMYLRLYSSAANNIKPALIVNGASWNFGVFSDNGSGEQMSISPGAAHTDITYGAWAGPAPQYPHGAVLGLDIAQLVAAGMSTGSQNVKFALFASGTGGTLQGATTTSRASLMIIDGT